MTRIATPARDAEQSPRVNIESDAKRVRLAQAYLYARAQGLVPAPHLVEAWDRFFSGCDPLIRLLACRRSVQYADRLDVCQEIWCALVTHLGQYDPGRGPFYGWLRALICNVAVSRDRARRRLRRCELGVEPLVADRTCNPADIYETAETREHFAAAMAELRTQLSERNYRIIHDHWFEGKEFSEIAVMLSLRVEQVRARHHRAMVKLGEILSRGS